MFNVWLAGTIAGMGLLLSPDHLRLWGNQAGRLGPLFWLAALGAAGLCALSIHSYNRLAATRTGGGGYLAALHGWGGNAAMGLALGSRAVLATGLATGILVTAGFVFNETFAYWFPNFGFAFLCLATAAVAHLWGYGAVAKLQAGLLAVALAGLTGLIVAGFWNLGAQPMVTADSSSAAPPGTLAGVWLLFVGFDLGIRPNDRHEDRKMRSIGMLTAVGIILVLLCLWGTVSLAHVPSDRLAGSFIPHTLAARKIGGQAGRILIGIVGIAGTVCAAMTLISAVARMTTALAKLQLLPRFLEGSGRRNLPAVIFTAGTVAVLMAAGVAGQQALEVFIRAGFLLWLLHIGLVHLAAYGATHSQASGATDAQAQGGWTAAIQIPAGLLAMAATVRLWFADEQRGLLAVFMLAGWAGTAAILYGVRWTGVHQSVTDK